MKYSISIWIICLFSSSCTSQVADVAFVNGNIYTANDQQPFVEAIAIEDDVIIYVGSSAEVQTVINSTTTVYDLQGKSMLPGIHDVHQHPLEASSTAGGNCTLNSFAGINSLKNSLANCNLTPNSNGWIVAYGHSIFSMLDAPQLTKTYLDDIYPNDPVCVLEETSHSVWVNSKALEELGITNNTSDPIGGHILKRNGQVDGVLMDAAGDIVLQTALASSPEIDQLHYEGLRDFGLPLLARNGITSVCEGRTYYKQNYQQIWQRLFDGDELSCRVTLAPWIYPDESDVRLIDTITSMYDDGNSYLSSRQIKLYSDGILINATAALHEPYNDNLGLPFNTGLNYIDVDRMTFLITELEKVGYDFHIHALGDRGITESLDAIEAARIANGDLGRRHRITHLETMDPEDYPRFAELDVLADFQVAANWTQPDSWNENIFFLGAERAQNFMPLKSVYDAGGLITLSSDWDVSTVNPFVGMEHAITRAPQNLPSIEEAVKAYTINAAYLMQRENQTGSLEVGKWADFICIDQNIFEIPKNNIGQTKVLSTWIGGEEVYNDIDFTTGITSINTQESDLFKVIISQTENYFTAIIPNENLTAIEVYTLNGNQVTVKNAINHSEIFFNSTKYPSGLYVVKGYLKNGRSQSQQISILK